MQFSEPRYIPGQGTTIVSRYHPLPEVVTDINFDFLIYADDIAGSVTRINGLGNVDWIHRTPFNPRSLHLTDTGEVYFVNGTKLTFLSIFDGRISKHLTPKIGLLSCASEQVSDFIYLCQRAIGDGGIFSFNVSTGEVSRVPGLNTSAARSVTVKNGSILAIADTFGHRVIVKDLKTGSSLTIPEYFPNDVNFTIDNNLLILGEHSNRLFEYNIDSSDISFIFGFHHKNNYKLMDYDDYFEFDTTDMILEDERLGSSSRADARIAGPMTLYSPNSFYLDEATGCTVISDTDNNRIVILDADSSLIGEVKGLTNVVAARIIFGDDTSDRCR